MHAVDVGVRTGAIVMGVVVGVVIACAVYVGKVSLDVISTVGVVTIVIGGVSASVVLLSESDTVAALTVTVAVTSSRRSRPADNNFSGVQ